jgi:hypothetical protein
VVVVVVRAPTVAIQSSVIAVTTAGTKVLRFIIILPSKMPCRSCVTTFARREVVASEGPLPVVTIHAAKRTSRCVVVQWLRCGHRFFPNAMTSIASQSFIPIVFRMTETDPKRARHPAGTDKTAGLMTHSTRRNIFFSGL